MLITTVMPSAAKSSISASTSRLALGSRLAVGSSRKSNCGRTAHARASARRCCWPSESTRAGRSRNSAMPTCRSAACALSARSPAGTRASHSAIIMLAHTDSRSSERTLEDHGLLDRRIQHAHPFAALQAVHHAQQRGLARAVAAEQCDTLAGVHVQRHRVECAHVAEAHRRVAQHDQRLGRGAPSSRRIRERWPTPHPPPSPQAGGARTWRVHRALPFCRLCTSAISALISATTAAARGRAQARAAGRPCSSRARWSSSSRASRRRCCRRRSSPRRPRRSRGRRP